MLAEIIHNLTEDNTYVYVRDDGIQDFPSLGRRCYQYTLWRLVVGRSHGEPVFEPIDTFVGVNETDLEELVAEHIEQHKLTLLEFTDAEFEAATGTPIGQACFDG